MSRVASRVEDAERRRECVAEAGTEVKGTMRTTKGPGDFFLAQVCGGMRHRSIGWRAFARGRRTSAIRACRFRAGMRGCLICGGAAESKAYCEEIRGVVAGFAELEITELFDASARGSWWRCIRLMTWRLMGLRPESVRGNPKARQAWAVEQLLLAAQSFGEPRTCGACDVFPGRLAWPYFYPWPQRAGRN